MRHNTIIIREKNKENLRIGTKHIKIGYIAYNKTSKWKAIFKHYGIEKFDKA